MVPSERFALEHYVGYHGKDNEADAFLYNLQLHK